MKKLLLGTAAIAVLSVGGSEIAEAVPAYAYAQVGFTGFTFSGLTAPGVSVSNTSVLLADGANYPGFTAVNNSIVGTLTSGGNVPQAYAGNGSVGTGTFTPALETGAAARGQSTITGPFSGPAVSNDVSEGRLTTPGGTASSNSSTKTGLDVTFTVTGGMTTLTLSFIAEALLKASTGQPGDEAASQINASYDIAIVNGDTGSIYSASNTGKGGNGTLSGTGAVTGTFSSYAFAPTDLNEDVLSVNGGASSTFSVTKFNVDDSVVLGPGVYQLKLDSGSTENITTGPAVPEPASLAVFGVGLLGLVAATRRRFRIGDVWRRLTS